MLIRSPASPALKPLRKGAGPIILLNGESIVDLMIEKQLGVSRTPLYVYEERPDELVGGIKE